MALPVTDFETEGAHGNEAGGPGPGWLEDTAFKTRYERGPPGSGWKLRRNEIAAICELATGAPAPAVMAVVAKPKPARCEDCFFHQNLLCALDLRAPCTTFKAG